MRDTYFDSLIRLYSQRLSILEETVFILVHNELSRANREYENWKAGGAPCPLVKKFIQEYFERSNRDEPRIFP